MSPASSGKLKIAAAAVLLIIVALGGVIVWLELPTGSGPDVIATPPAVFPATTQPAAPKSDFRKFLRVVQSDDAKQAAEMLAADPSLIKQTRTRDGATALHLAVSVSMARLLLNSGADINAQKTPATGTPLRWAASNLWDRKPGTRELVQFLRSKGASEPDIYLATSVGDIDQMKKLLAADPSLLDKPDRNEQVLYDTCPPLQMAAYADQFEAAKFLIDQGANVRGRGGWHNTEPLEKAAWVGDADVTALLLDHGGTVNGPGTNAKDSPLYNAATMGHADVVKILLAHGATFPRRLIADVRTAMQHPYSDGPTPGSAADFQAVLDMLTASAATQPGAR